jgi:hypothetical protein
VSVSRSIRNSSLGIVPSLGEVVWTGASTPRPCAPRAARGPRRCRRRCRRAAASGAAVRAARRPALPRGGRRARWRVRARARSGAAPRSLPRAWSSPASECVCIVATGLGKPSFGSIRLHAGPTQTQVRRSVGRIQTHAAAVLFRAPARNGPPPEPALTDALHELRPVGASARAMSGFRTRYR